MQLRSAPIDYNANLSGINADGTTVTTTVLIYGVVLLLIVGSVACYVLYTIRNESLSLSLPMTASSASNTIIVMTPQLRPCTEETRIPDAIYIEIRFSSEEGVRRRRSPSVLDLEGGVGSVGSVGRVRGAEEASESKKEV